MENQKLENLLNLSLEATPEQRAHSESLAVGFDAEERTWELIVKHSQPLPEMEGVEAEELLNNYSILRVQESRIDAVSRLPQVEYIEKPKRLYFSVAQARADACITPLQVPDNAYAPYLTGRGILTAVLDSGIDYYHEAFRNPDGTTRIAALWDQNLGRMFTREEINGALETGSRGEARALVPSVDGSGHGTAVAGIAAGRADGADGAAGGSLRTGGSPSYRGVAYESNLLVVKLGTPDALGFPRTTELMRGLDFAARFAVEAGKPLAVNVSFGNTYGSHEGTSLLETYINGISNFGRMSIVIGAGNEGNAGGHVSGILRDGREEVIELSVSPYETGLSVQLWKQYADEFAITLTAPDGQRFGPLPPVIGPQMLSAGGTQVLLYYGEPSPYSSAQEIYFDMIPRGDYLTSGLWKFHLTPRRVAAGRYDFWLPPSPVLNRSTYFLRATPDTTLTIPSTASMAITTGAYDSSLQAYADFSGRGFTRVTDQIKPDIAAPGVNLLAPKNGGGYEAVTGTSFAAPVAAGSAALLMQWGIVDGNDPFLYGEKLKAYLIRGARRLPGYEMWPNPLLGWGTLCVRESLPE